MCDSVEIIHLQKQNVVTAPAGARAGAEAGALPPSQGAEVRNRQQSSGWMHEGIDPGPDPVQQLPLPCHSISNDSVPSGEVLTLTCMIAGNRRQEHL
jgi:hypothetical protein